MMRLKNKKETKHRSRYVPSPRGSAFFILENIPSYVINFVLVYGSLKSPSLRKDVQLVRNVRTLVLKELMSSANMSTL